MIDLVNINKTYNDKVVLREFNYHFKSEGLYLVSGVSGCGKSTLLNIIASRDKNYLGLVNTKRKVFYLMEEDLIGSFTVKEHIELIKDLYKDFKERKEKYGLEKIYNKCINKLSLGERQRLCVYLSICSNSRIVLLDEPLSFLDDKNKMKIINSIQKESKSRLFIVSSHDLSGFKNYKEIRLDKDNFNDVIFKEKEKQTYSERKNINYKKWGMTLIRKNFISLLLFIVSISSISIYFSLVSEEIKNIEKEFNMSFNEGELYYKEGNIHLDEDSFYNEVVLELSNEVNAYGINMYDEKMYDHKVYIDKYYFDNGFIFSNMLEGINLEVGEVIVSLDYDEFCFKNNVLYCNENTLSDSLVGKELIYLASKEYHFKIKQIIRGENAIFVDNKKEVYDLLKEEFINYHNMYYLQIKVNKTDDFNKKINYVDSLLKYDFIKYYQDKDNVYFVIKPAKNTYFNYQELEEEKLVGCSEIISCDVFSFTSVAINSIDDMKIDGKIKFSLFGEYLFDDEIVISSSLSNALDKKKGEKIKIKYYLNKDMYIDEMIIKDIIEEKENYIYHNSRYSYLVYNKLVGESSRITYAYGESQKYSKRSLIYNEVIDEVMKVINGLYLSVNIVFIGLVTLMIIIVFFIESKRHKKYIKFYKFVLTHDYKDYLKVFRVYLCIYICIGVYLLFIDFIIGFIYFVILFFYYIVEKRKIKIQVSPD